MTALRPPHRHLSHPPTRPWLAMAVSMIVALVLASAAPAHALKPFGASGSALQGRYRALVVWVEDYEHWTHLSAPKKDAERIARALTDKYLFAPDDVELLGNPTQAELFKAVKSIATKAKAEDSVLIVFAGHGFLETASGQGYWVPRDAKRPGDTAELSYLSSSWVRDVLKGSAALHVAVVSDSCFSGALLGSRGEEGSALTGDAYYAKMYQRRSFEGLTSGALETVDDSGAPGGHSPFAYYLAVALEKPDGPVFDLQDVFQRVRQGVKTLSKQTPLFGRLAGAPSDGGGFVFVAKDGVVAGAAVATAEPTRSGAQRSDGEPSAAAATPSGPSAETVAAFAQLRQALAGQKDDEVVRIGLRARFCEMGHFQGCAILANAYDTGEGTVADPARALELFTSANRLAGPACDRDDELACAVLGDSLVRGRGIAADLTRGAKLLRKACDLGQGGACGALGAYMVDKKVAGGATAAAQLFDKGCRTGDPESCYRAGQAWDEALGVNADPAKAATLYAEGCDGGYRAACGALGVLYIDGRGVARDLDAALQLGAHGCEVDDARSCAVQGAVLFVGTSRAPADAARALTLLRKGCDGGNGEGCYGMGQILYANGDLSTSKPEEARAAFERGCKLRSGESCTLLGAFLDDGVGGDMDFTRAKKLYDAGCKLGDADGCKKRDE